MMSIIPDDPFADRSWRGARGLPIGESSGLRDRPRLDARHMAATKVLDFSPRSISTAVATQPAGQAIIQLPAAGRHPCLPFPKKGRGRRRHSNFAEVRAVRYTNTWYIHQLSRTSMRTDDRSRLLESEGLEIG